MIQKVQYVNYKQRVRQGVLKVLYTSVILVILMFLNDIRFLGIVFIASIYLSISAIYIYNVFKISRFYLSEIKIEGEKCEFVIYEFDNKISVIQSNLSDTRIKIWEIFFPFTKFGRNFKMVIEVKSGYRYSRIIQQYEIGSWDIDKFKSVVEHYCFEKELPITKGVYNRR